MTRYSPAMRPALIALIAGGVWVACVAVSVAVNWGRAYDDFDGWTVGLAGLAAVAVIGTMAGNFGEARAKRDQYPGEVGRVVVVAVAAVLLVAGLAAVSLLGQGNPADVQAMEDAIADDLADNVLASGGEAPQEIDVQCPSELEIEPGREFDCVATVDGFEAAIVGRWQNDDGEYVWRAE